jgi:hypothetical protein
MGHLLRSELVRFRLPAAAFAAVHLVILGYLAAGDLFAPSLPRIAVGLVVYALAGLILGLYQMASHGRPNRWVYLLHRPLAPGRIHLALAGAGAVVILVAVTVPQLLVTAAVALSPAQPVDLRHLLLVAFVFVTVYVFYLAGTFIALSPTRGAWLVLVLPTFFLTRQAQGPWVLLPALLVLLWLGWLSRAAFKPVLDAPLRRPLALVAAALPMQYALFWLLGGGIALGHQFTIMFHEAGWKGPAVFAWNDYFQDGAFDHVNYLDGADALAHGLRTADNPRAAQLRGQIRLADVGEVSPVYPSFPVRHQPMFMDRSPVLVDEEAEIRWTFQHDAMLFHGRDARTGAAVGWLGPRGRLGGPGAPPADAERFPAVPVVAANRFLVVPDRLWEYEPRGRTLDPALRLRFVAPDGERLAAPLQVQGRFATLLTDRALYLFASRDLERVDGVLQPTGVAPLPGAVDNLKRIAVAELIDGHLVSFLFGTRSSRDLAPARQVVMEVGLDGSRQVVAERQLAPETFGVAYRHRGFLMSPVWQLLHDAAWTAIAPRRPTGASPARVLAHPPPPAILAGAAGVALVSALLAAALVRRRALTPWGRRGWIAACALLGLPALASLPLLTAPAEADPPAVAARRGATPHLAREAA